MASRLSWDRALQSQPNTPPNPSRCSCAGDSCDSPPKRRDSGFGRLKEGDSSNFFAGLGRVGPAVDRVELLDANLGASPAIGLALKLQA
jgi:hypothetical protein